MESRETKEFLESFQSFLGSPKAREWEEDREERTELFQEKFSKEHIGALGEEEIEQVIKRLWATQLWTNKDYIFTKIVDENGFENIRESFKELFYGEEKIADRFDTFRNKIKHIGPSMLTEIMAFVDPNKYCVWNDKPKNTLPYLELGRDLPERVFKYQIDGSDYEKCLKVMEEVRKEISGAIKNPDFIDVDFFLTYLFYEAEEDLKEEKEKKEKISEVSIAIESHSDAQGVLLKLGKLLGYDTYIPKEDRAKKFQREELGDMAALEGMPLFSYEEIVRSASHIDVVWFREEFPYACFEVEETTRVTKGLNRLGDLEGFDVRMFIVGSKEKKKKFNKEIDRYSFRKIRDRTKFLDYEILVEFYEFARKFTELRKEVLGR